MPKPIYAGVTKPTVTPVEDGTYGAVLFQFIQLGEQKFGKDGREWYSPKIMLGFEIPELTYETQNGPATQIKSVECFLSMNESKNGQIGLREVMDGLRGHKEWTAEELEQFDISQYFGQACKISIAGVVSQGKAYSNITAVEPVDEVESAAILLSAQREPIFVTVDDFGDESVIGALPGWIQDKIRASREYKALVVAENEPAEEIQIESSEIPSDIKLSDIQF